MNIPHFGLKRQYQNLKDELLDATDRALKDGQLVGGHYTRTFEEWLKHRCNTKYAVTMHSGTQALEIIASYLKLLEHGSTVRLPNLTYPATLNAFLNAGWNIELEDTDKYGIMTMNGTLKKREDYICLIGLYGMKPWEQAKIENTNNIIVDGAQHWLVADGQVGVGMAISFDPTKNLPSSGNGGAIVTNEPNLYLYASHYKDNFKPYFESTGTNSKMSEQDCAQILVRTKYINEWQARRKSIAYYWLDAFEDLPINCLTTKHVPHAHQKFVIYTSDRNTLHTNMLLSGIETKIHYEYVLGDLPSAKTIKKPDLLSKSVMLSRGVLSLPLYPELTDNEVEFIADTVRNYFKT